MGWTGRGVAEAYGGVGTFLALVVVLEEAGRSLLPGPFFSTMGLAVPALLEAGTERQKEAVLGRIASGDARATLAFSEPVGGWDPAGREGGSVPLLDRGAPERPVDRSPGEKGHDSPLVLGSLRERESAGRHP